MRRDVNVEASGLHPQKTQNNAEGQRGDALRQKNTFYLKLPYFPHIFTKLGTFTQIKLTDKIVKIIASHGVKSNEKTKKVNLTSDR